YHGWNASRSSSGELASVIVCGCTVHIAAAVNPDNHRKASGRWSGPCAKLRCENVQVKTVLVHACWTCDNAECCHLGADVADMSCVARFVPFRDWLGRHPAQVAYGRSGVGDAAKFVNTIPGETRDRSLGCVYNRCRVVAGGYGSAGCCRK